MLAAPRPPALTVGCFKFQNPSANVNLVQRNVGSSNCKRVVVAAKATYSRVPLDTPGAYQLIDEDTGEKFIVWGSAEDDSSNSPIPSNEVLSWKPLPSPNNNNNDNDSTINQASNRGSTGNFGRLKFRRMRDLVRKSYTKNKKRDVIEHDEHNVTNTSSQSSTSSYGELDQLKEKQKLSARALAKIQQLESRKNSPKIIRMEDEGYNGDFDAEFGRLVDSRSKASASSLRGWGRGQSIHDRSMGEEISRRRQNLDDRNNFFSRKSFHDMGCSDYMIEALRNQHFVRPSHIQSLTFEPIMAGKSCIVSDQSGSGKTLAYLLPLIQRLRQEELQGLSKPSPQSPRVVILAPTTELASQVLNTCRSFSKSGVPFRSMVVTGGFRQRTQLENLRQELDVLIATPGRFMFLIKEGYLQLTNLKCAVLDEVDILFNDEDFETAFQCLINSSPIITQYLFVTATLPMDIYNKLVESFPDCELVTGPGMHRTSPGLEETTSQERDMMKHLLAMMTNLCKKVEKIETEVQNLKANSQQHDSKHAELGQQHDQKHAKLQGDVGKLQKTHNNICSNAATASTSTAGQSAKKEEAKVKYTNINMNRLFSKPYTPQNTQKDISITPQTNTYKASLESQKQTYNYISRTYIENIYKVQTFLNQNPRAKNTKNPNENYVTQYLQGYNKLIAQPGTNPNLIATCYNYGLLSTVYTVTGDEISKIPELYKAFLQYKRVTKGTLFYIKIYGRILYDEVKPTIQVIKIGLTREMIIPEKIDTQEEIQKVDIPEFYANKRIIGIATILNEITNNYLNENAIWTYYNRDQTIIYSNCRDIREADMEKLRQWILSLLRPETMPTTRAIRKNFISSNLMTRYCKLIGQKYPDHLCSKCEGEKNYIPDVQLE